VQNFRPERLAAKDRDSAFKIGCPSASLRDQIFSGG
jgi:hypothetical protein